MVIPRGYRRRVRAWAGGVVLLCLGIVIGSSVRPFRAPGSPSSAVTAAEAPHSESAAPASVAGGGELETSIPAFRPFVAAPDDFGGRYALLSGARTAGSAAAPPAFPTAPDVPVGAAVPQAETRAPAASASSAREPDRPRRRPAQAIPRGIALRTPLLALARPGGRVVLRDLGTTPRPAPTGIEGEWAVIGECESRVSVEFALPAARAGEMRGVGRAAEETPWRVEPVVAAQACATATAQYRRPRAASEEQRTAFGPVAAALSVGIEDLREVVELPAGALLVFRGPGGRSVVAAVARGSSGPAALWSHVSGDGDLWLLGVYRSGVATEAWILVGDRSAPRALLIASSIDRRTWSATGPLPLRDD